MTQRRGRPVLPVADGDGAEFANSLRSLLAEAGLSVRQLATRAGYSPSTISIALSGKNVPSLRVTLAVVRACGGDPNEWAPRWTEAAEAITSPKTRTVRSVPRPPLPTLTPPFGRLSKHRATPENVPLIAREWSKSPAQVLVLHGSAGIGKTTAALEIARSHAEHRRTWWIQAENSREVHRGMLALASELGTERPQLDLAWDGEGFAADLVWRLLLSQSQPWLLVFDGADDPDLLTMGERLADGNGWIRPTVGSVGAIVVTSRNSDRDTWGRWCTMRHVSQVWGTGRPTLSVQERTVLLLWFQGMSKASVARRMAISENTVREYLQRVREKYALVGRPAPTKEILLVRAIDDGLLQLDEVDVYQSMAAKPLSDV